VGSDDLDRECFVRLWTYTTLPVCIFSFRQCIIIFSRALQEPLHSSPERFRLPRLSRYSGFVFASFVCNVLLLALVGTITASVMFPGQHLYKSMVQLVRHDDDPSVIPRADVSGGAVTSASKETITLPLSSTALPPISKTSLSTVVPVPLQTISSSSLPVPTSSEAYGMPSIVAMYFA
jgi:hypothetical protein